VARATQSVISRVLIFYVVDLRRRLPSTVEPSGDRPTLRDRPRGAAHSGRAQIMNGVILTAVLSALNSACSPPRA